MRRGGLQMSGRARSTWRKILARQLGNSGIQGIYRTDPVLLTTFLETSSNSSFSTCPLLPRGHRCFWTGLFQPHLSCPTLTHTPETGSPVLCVCKQDPSLYCSVVRFVCFPVYLGDVSCVAVWIFHILPRGCRTFQLPGHPL